MPLRGTQCKNSTRSKKNAHGREYGPWSPPSSARLEPFTTTTSVRSCAEWAALSAPRAGQCRAVTAQPVQPERHAQRDIQLFYYDGFRGADVVLFHDAKRVRRADAAC